MSQKLLKFLALLLISIISVALFYFGPPTQKASAAVVFVQTAKNTAATNSVSATWSGSTTDGNFLVAVVSSSRMGGVPSISAPSGWSQAVTIGGWGASYRTTIFYYENAPSQSSTGNFTSDSAINMALIVAEYSGVATSSPLDQTATNSGSSSTPSTGTTGATTQADELLIGGVGVTPSVTFSSPTNSFAIENSQAYTPSGALLDRIVSSTDTYSTGATISSSTTWGGVIATFKAVAADGGGGLGIRNQLKRGSITFNVESTGGDGTFKFSVNGSGYYNEFSVTTKNGTGSVTQNNLSEGAYSTTVTIPQGWTKTQDNCTFIIVSANQNTSCLVKAEKPNPVPTLTSISPTSKTVDDDQFTMTLTGTDFVSSSKVRWEGQDRDTTYLSATKLTTIINKSDLTKVGKFNITVFNPALGGGTSNAIQFEVTEKNPIPTITTISPNQKQVNSSQFTITVDGTGFIKDSVVRFAGSDRNTTYVSATNLTAVIRVADLKKEGVFKITVFNPAPGGGTSNSKDFTVTKAETAKLVINVNTTNGNDTFTFNVRGSSNSTIGVTTINANGSFTKDNIAAGSYSVEQLSKELWKLQSASCATQDGAKTGSLSQNTISGVLVQDKQTTTCSFYNIKEIPIAPISPGGDSQDEAVFFGTELIINGVVEFIQNSVENVIESAKIVAEGAVIVIDYSREVVDTPVVSVVTKVITTTGVSLATIVVVSAPGFPISEIFMTPIRLWGLLLSLLGIKKKTLPWGVVYDSQTKQPLDPAYVTLKDSSGKQVSSAITDIDGRYGFLVGSGVYTIEARKTNYAFPSKKVTGVDDEVYNNLYHGENIEIKKGEVITKNIALDPLKFDWNEFAKKNKNFMKFYSKWDMIIRKISDPSFIIGFIVSILVLVLVPKPYNMIILGCYITVLALRAVVRALGIQPKTAGYLTDKKTGNPLSFAVVRVFIPSTNTQVSQKVADKLGRYYCLVPKGRYYLKIEQKNADGSYTEVYTSPVIDASKNGIIRQRFKV